MITELKQQQKALIERYATPVDYVKQQIITICDEQISAIPELDQGRYIFAVRSFEHPEGYKLAMDVHPCLRIREGVIVRDHAENPEGFFWTDTFYQKMKKKSKCYFIGTETGEYLENYVNLRNLLKKPADGKQLSFKVASRKKPLEVFETPAEQRTAILVTEELAKALDYKIIEAYNDEDPENTSPCMPGDLLVQDTDPVHAGLYYRVDAKTASETYREGTI